VTFGERLSTCGKARPFAEQPSLPWVWVVMAVPLAKHEDALGRSASFCKSTVKSS